METCDVLVIGAGPAGIVAALTALKDGRDKDVFLLEASGSVGGNTSEKIDLTVPDEKLESIIDHLDVPVRHISNTSKWFSPSNKYFELTSRHPDYWFKRGLSSDSFESKMASRFREEGGVLRLGEKAVDIRQRNGNVKTKVITEGESYSIKSDVVICAAGLTTSLYRKVTKEETSYDKIIGRRFKGYGFNIKPGTPYIFFDQKISPGSYIFALGDPKSETGYIIFGGFSNMKQEVDWENIGHRGVDKILEGATIEDETNDLLYVQKRNRKVRKGRVLFAGDAAGLMDPLLHYGIRQAIKSGYAASKSAIAHIDNDKSLNSYDEFCQREFFVKINEARRYRKIFNILKNKDIDAIFDVLVSLSRMKVDMDNIIDKPKRHVHQILIASLLNCRSIHVAMKALINQGK